MELMCQLCQEKILPTEKIADARPLVAHVECALRETQGGIGHHLDHVAGGKTRRTRVCKKCGQTLDRK